MAAGVPKVIPVEGAAAVPKLRPEAVVVAVAPSGCGRVPKLNPDDCAEAFDRNKTLYTQLT